jgi:DNA-binding NtrC family response regulator
MRDTPLPVTGNIRVLVASRDPIYSRFLTERLVVEGIEVARPAPLLGSDSVPDPSRIDVVLVETHGLDDAAWALIEAIREGAPLVEVIAISSGPLVDRAVQALRLGVFSILSYPVSDDQLTSEVKRACARKRRGEARLKATEGRLS